jgi:hypothetical protein
VFDYLSINEVFMKVDYNAVSDSMFGRFLGCAFSTDAANIMGELDFSKVEVDLKIDGKDVDCLKTISLLSTSLAKDAEEAAKDAKDAKDAEEAARVVATATRTSGVPVAPEDGTSPLADSNQLELLVSRLEALDTALSEAESQVNEQCSDAISSASSSYYCGDYASEAASEAGWEHHPGDDFLCELRSEVSDMHDDLQAIVEALQGAAR